MANPPIKITLEYDGSAYHGWQRQPNRRTVQGELEEALSIICRQPIAVVGQGRTDRGVHAEGQVAHTFLNAEDIDLPDLMKRLNGLLGSTCQVRELVPENEGFHARYSAISRHYRYQITREPSPLRRRTHWYVKDRLDSEKIVEACTLCLGEHDFGVFCSHGQDQQHTRCAVTAFTMDEKGAIVTFHIAANRFLHNMVRRLIGEMVLIGRGRHSVELFESRLDSPGPAEAGLTAPPHGLFLERVVYPAANSASDNS